MEKIILESGDFGTWIVRSKKTGKTVLFQVDWDFPPLAVTFGHKLTCHCPEGPASDGTVKCEKCGKTPTEFISESIDFLNDHKGDETEDPGYFE